MLTKDNQLYIKFNYFQQINVLSTQPVLWENTNNTFNGRMWDFPSGSLNNHIQTEQITKIYFIYSTTFLYCLFYVLGYGHITPSTTTGRVVTIIYAIFGIPIFLILLADFGKLFTRSIKFVWAFVRRLYYTGSCRKVRKTDTVQVRNNLHSIFCC